MATVKQREYLLTVDDFNNPQVVEGKSAIALLLSRLILLDPGSDPLHPDMGVGIRKFRFDNNKNVLSDIRSRIQKQMETYLPTFQATEVVVNITDNKELTINISVGDTTYVYSSDINESDNTLEDIMFN